MVERRVVFYRWQSANAQQAFIPYEVARELAENISRDHTAAMVRRRDSTTAVEVLDAGSATTPARFQVLAVRNDEDRPVEWSPGQSVRSLVMDEGYSTADVAYFMIWPDGYAAQDWHQFAPRPSRLAQVLRLNSRAHVSFNILYRPDMLASLRRLRGHLRSVELAITSPELVDADRVGMMSTLFPAAFGSRAPSLSLRLGMGRYGPRDRYIDHETEEAIFEIAENAQELVDSLTVRGVDPDTGRTLTVNLLQERIGRHVDVDGNPEAITLPDEGAIFDEMAEVRRDLEAEGLLGAALEAQAMRP